MNKDKSAERYSLRRLALLVWKESLTMPFLSFVMMVVIVLAESTNLIAPYFVQRLVDGIVEGRFLDMELVQVVLLYALPIAAAGFIGALLWRLTGFIGSAIDPKIRANLTATAYRSLFDQSYRFFTDHFTGSLVRKIQSLGSSGGELLQAIWWEILPMAWSILLGTWLVSRHGSVLGVIIFVWAIFLLAINLFFSKIKLSYDNKRASTYSKVVGSISDSVSNFVNISLFAARKEEEVGLGADLEEARDAGARAWRVGEWGFMIQDLLMFICEFAVLAVVISRWKLGLMTVGEVVFVQGVLLALFHATFRMGRVIRRLYEAASDAHEILDIMDMQPEVRDLKSAKALKVKRSAIRFENVSFQYVKGGETAVLEDVTLDIKPKEKIALVGASGAGKSTITKLLFRFFDVNSGRILIDGQDISKVTQESLREAIAHVPQESILFHRSLLENIRYGKRDATDADVHEAARAAHCHEFISAFPQGYETLVGERGVKLSGGERQRIAIARAILKNAPILVLDEATSSLDSESESLIQDSLKHLMKNKTVIVIAHRLSTIMEMDRIIVMENGKILDEGTHESLKAKVGTYRRLWNIQAGGFQG